MTQLIFMGPGDNIVSTDPTCPLRYIEEPVQIGRAIFVLNGRGVRATLRRDVEPRQL